VANNNLKRSIAMRVLSESEVGQVSGAGVYVEPLIDDPQSEFGEMLNDMHEGYINFLNAYVFPYVYYCF
jgi:hypothetical protein